MAEVPEPQTLPTPEFGRIRAESGRATEDAIRLLWLGVNANLRSATRLNSRLRNQLQWKEVPFNASDFSAPVGTWTVESGDFLFYRTLVVNDLAFVWVAVTTTTTSGGPSALRITLPFDVDLSGTVGPVAVGSVYIAFTGAEVISSLRVLDVGTDDWRLTITREDGVAQYPNQTDLVDVSVIATMRIVP